MLIPFYIFMKAFIYQNIIMLMNVSARFEEDQSTSFAVLYDIRIF